MMHEDAHRAIKAARWEEPIPVAELEAAVADVFALADAIGRDEALERVSDAIVRARGAGVEFDDLLEWVACRLTLAYGRERCSIVAAVVHT